MEIIVDKYQQVIFDYAVNRAELKVIVKKINDLPFNEKNEHEYIDLSGFRDDWYGGEDYDSNPRWEGWVQAVEAGEHEPKQLELAKLFDKRTKIKAEAGQLKRNMCAYGRALISKENKS